MYDECCGEKNEDHRDCEVDKLLFQGVEGKMFPLAWLAGNESWCA